MAWVDRFISGEHAAAIPSLRVVVIRPAACAVRPEDHTRGVGLATKVSVNGKPAGCSRWYPEVPTLRFVGHEEVRTANQLIDGHFERVG
jgi:hypothetical protein